MRSPPLTLALALLAIPGSAVAGELFVICHADVTLAAADVRDVFLGEKQFVGAIRILPADNAERQAAFLAAALHMDAARYSVTWTKKSFRDGVSPPPIKGSDLEALEFVKRTAGACSYVGAQPPVGLTIVAKLGL